MAEPCHGVRDGDSYFPLYPFVQSLYGVIFDFEIFRSRATTPILTYIYIYVYPTRRPRYSGRAIFFRRIRHIYPATWHPSTLVTVFSLFYLLRYLSRAKGVDIGGADVTRTRGEFPALGLGFRRFHTAEISLASVSIGNDPYMYIYT